jgi:preprotein translocase subunit SecG
MHLGYIVCLVLEVIFALTLVALVLIHPPKGEGMGGIGGSATLFSGARGAESGLDRITYIVIALFMLVCLLLGFGIVR